jgi:hypothetical protein
MGYKINYNIQDIESGIRRMFRECSNSRNDGFVAWGIKQDLYQLKWMIDDLLRESPDFSGEKEWLLEQEKKKVIDILKSEN